MTTEKVEIVSSNNLRKKVLKIRDKVEGFCLSTQFIFIACLMAFVFHALALDLVGILSFAISAAISFLVFKNGRVGITFVTIAIFNVSTKNSPGYMFEGSPNYYFTPAVLIPLICAVALVIVAMVYRCIKNRKNYKYGKSYIPLGVLAVITTISGIGQEYFLESFGFAILMGLSYVGIYMLFVGCVDGEELLEFISILFTALALLISLQIAFLYFKQMVKGGDFDSSWKNKIILGWGISNNAGEILTFFMPFILYKVEKSKNYVNYLLIALFSMVMLVFTLNRAGMLVGFPLFAILYVKTLIFSPNRGKIFLISLIVLSVGIILLTGLTAFTDLSSTFKYFENLFGQNNKIHLSGRDKLWKRSWNYFLESKWIGTGFARAYHEPVLASENSIFQSLAHNFIIQAFGSGGIVGVLAVLFYLGYSLKLILKKYEGRIYVCCFAVAFLGACSFDIVYFLPYCMMYLFLVTIMVERATYKDKNTNKIAERTEKWIKK